MTQINKIRNERGDITTGTKETQDHEITMNTYTPTDYTI